MVCFALILSAANHTFGVVMINVNANIPVFKDYLSFKAKR